MNLCTQNEIDSVREFPHKQTKAIFSWDYFQIKFFIAKNSSSGKNVATLVRRATHNPKVRGSKRRGGRWFFILDFSTIFISLCHFWTIFHHLQRIQVQKVITFSLIIKIWIAQWAKIWFGIDKIIRNLNVCQHRDENML